jgi:single-stranded DNA-specific DHH superfamily exonuclease
MLTETQLKEIREHLENAKNPIFFFDNDPDGLCSFLILQRFIGRGKGISLRGHSNVSKSFFKRVQELNADYIFVLDRAVFEDGFLELANEANIPVVGIDHHDIPKPNIKYYYKSLRRWH